jgi:hypothetical protein
VTWSPSSLRLNNRLTPVSLRWFATAVAAVAVVVMAAGVVAVVAVAAVAATLLPMRRPLATTAVGKTDLMPSPVIELVFLLSHR